MLIAMMVQAAVPNAAGFDHPWLRIGRSPALSGPSEEVVVVRTTVGDVAGRHPIDRLRLIRRNRGGGHVATHTFLTDSRACPAAARLPADVEAMPMPHAVSPDSPTDIVLDGVGYSVTVEASYGDMGGLTTFESNLDTPLAAWVDTRLAALAPCWKPA
ncbi:hypothetical protein ACU5AX_10725 [Sphingomonas sp. XXL09]|uniref:hypothetical protein n=1 Tax=Sphingomonas sp. XXL09 TaxID=3457787 RepID=UPI00406BBDE4